MKLDSTDRRRVAIASVLTFVALPAVWLANDESTAGPNLAAVGLDAADHPRPASTTVTTVVVEQPAYLTPAPPSPAASAPAISVVVGSSDDVVGTGTATFRRDVGPGWCEVAGAADVGRVTVANAANGHEVTCRVDDTTSATPGIVVVLSRTDFGAIADFADAPIHVELRE